jgi:hypothetical protein
MCRRFFPEVGWLPEAREGSTVPENHGEATEKRGTGYNRAGKKDAKAASKWGFTE